MNIADKLVTIAENIQKVYNAGKLSVMEASASLKGSASGSYVNITDVSPIEHNVGVELSSETITNFSGVKVTVGGTNLFDVLKVKNSEYITNNGDGTITISGTYGTSAGAKLRELCPSLKVGDVVVFQIVSTGNTVMYLAGSGYTWQNWASRTITEADLNSVVNLYGKLDKATYTISQIMLNYGTTRLPYEQYIEPTEYTSTANGIVNGIKSRYPSMSFSTDAEGVNINVKYYRDIDKVIDGITTSVALLGGE